MKRKNNYERYKLYKEKTDLSKDSICKTKWEVIEKDILQKWCNNLWFIKLKNKYWNINDLYVYFQNWNCKWEKAFSDDKIRVWE